MARTKPVFGIGSLASGLEEIAMLVYLYIGSFNRERVNAEVGEDVARRARARGPEVGDYILKLIPADELKTINTLGSKMRDEHYNLTLPWSYQGWRVLPAAMYGAYTRRIDKLIKERKTATNKFLNKYPRLKREERTRLGTLFNASLYPTKAQLQKRIIAEYSFAPMPSTTHFIVVGVSEREHTRIRVNIEKDVELRVAIAARDLYGRLEEQIQLVSRQLGVKADGRRNRLFGSSLDNLRELAEFVPDLNLTDNAYMNEAAMDISRLLNGVTADELRSNARFRAQVKVEVDRLSERFAVGYMLPPIP